MDNTTEKDPWANMNAAPGKKTGEASQADLEREEEWKKTMSDVPEFNNNSIFNNPATESPAETPTNVPTTEQTPERDETIADATAIINYGLNAASREKGVEVVIQTINNFVPNGIDNPIDQLFSELGIKTRADLTSVKEESNASKSSINAFRNESINAPNTVNKSSSGALYAIAEVKKLVAEVETSPDYADLRAEAISNGKGIFEYAVAKYNVRDLTVLFNALSERKKQHETGANLPEEKPEDQTENQIEKEPGNNNSIQ